MEQILSRRINMKDKELEERNQILKLQKHDKCIQKVQL